MSKEEKNVDVQERFDHIRRTFQNLMLKVSGAIFLENN